MSHFNYHNITLNTSVKWEIAKAIIDFNSQLYAIASTQSEQKSQFTMGASQAGQERSSELKFQMQLMGTLAEIYSQEYLIEIITAANFSGLWKVIRYDDVRTDGFRSAANEYDIKIEALDGTKDFKVESRSSIAHDRSLKTS